MTYQLRCLRLHGLIQRIPKTHRYQVTDLGFRAGLFFSKVYSRILRPGFAFVLPDIVATDGKLRRAFAMSTRRSKTGSKMQNLSQLENLTHSVQLLLFKTP